MDEVIVFNDKSYIERARDPRFRTGAVVRAQLVQFVPPNYIEHLGSWRERWGGKRIVLVAGQIRGDKGLPILIEAVARLQTQEVIVAIVGPDAGYGEKLRALVANSKLFDLQIGYLPLDMFVAAIAAADVVVCPYVEGTQSGVLAIAASVGTPSIAARIGGLGDQATSSFEPGDVLGLASCISDVISASSATDTDEVC